MSVKRSIVFLYCLLLVACQKSSVWDESAVLRLFKGNIEEFQFFVDECEKNASLSFITLEEESKAVKHEVLTDKLRKVGAVSMHCLRDYRQEEMLKPLSMVKILLYKDGYVFAGESFSLVYIFDYALNDKSMFIAEEIESRTFVSTGYSNWFVQHVIN